MVNRPEHSKEEKRPGVEKVDIVHPNPSTKDSDPRVRRLESLPGVTKDKNLETYPRRLFETNHIMFRNRTALDQRNR